MKDREVTEQREECAVRRCSDFGTASVTNGPWPVGSEEGGGDRAG